MSLLTMTASLAAAALLPLALSSRPAAHAPRLGRAVQVRLDADLIDQLLIVENRTAGQSDFSRSQMIRDAVSAYVDLLVECVDSDRTSDAELQSHLPEPPGEHETFGETTRIRFDAGTVDQLDRVEAYARGRLGYRHVTRSSLIRRGVRSYLTGFNAELAQLRRPR